MLDAFNRFIVTRSFYTEFSRQLGYAVDLVLHRLFAIGACSNFDAGGYAWCAHCVDAFVAELDRRKDFVPVALDVGAVRMKLVF